MNETEWEQEIRGYRGRPQRPGNFRPPGFRRLVGRIRSPRFSAKPIIRRPVRRSLILAREPFIAPSSHPSEYGRWVQSSLNTVLGLNLPVTGVIDARTRRAIQQFQQREGLTVDGIAGPETKDALVRAKGQGDAQTPVTQQTPEPDAKKEEPMSTEYFDELEFETLLTEDDQYEDEFLENLEFEDEATAYETPTTQWPTRSSFNPQHVGTIPSGPFQTSRTTCPAMVDFTLLRPILRSLFKRLQVIRTLNNQTPINTSALESERNLLKKEFTSIKIGIDGIRRRIKSGEYRRQGCTDRDFAKVTCSARALYRELGGLEPAKQTLKPLYRKMIYDLRHSRGRFAGVDCSRL